MSLFYIGHRDMADLGSKCDFKPTRGRYCLRQFDVHQLL